MKTLTNKIIKLALLSFLLLNSAACAPTMARGVNMNDYASVPQTRNITVMTDTSLEDF